MGLFSNIRASVAAFLASSVGLKSFNPKHGTLEAAPQKRKDAPKRRRWKANATHPNCAVELRDRVSHNGTAFVYPNNRR